MFRLFALGGDGIGPEVTAAGLRLFRAVCGAERIAFEIAEDLIGGACRDAHGTLVRDETVAAAKAADAVLVGSVGGEAWDGIRVPGGPEMQDGLMRLRKELDVYAGLRPARAWPALAHLTPFRPEVIEGADIMILREMTGGAFMTAERGVEVRDNRRIGYDLSIHGEDEVARVVRVGFELARRRRGLLWSAEKANVMETYVLWRTVAEEVAAENPDVGFRSVYADNCAFQIARDPAAVDVVVADNLFGDILSDLTGALAGSLGMLPSACLQGLGEPGRPPRGIYEPVHGTAPDIADKGIANPIGALLSVAMIFEFAVVRPDLARRVEAAVDRSLENGRRTADIGGTSSTEEVTEAVVTDVVARLAA